MKNYHADAAFAQELISTIHAKKVDAVFSYDYFPMLSMICEINQLPYFSWIYDCPMYTLMSKTLSNPCNYIFCFDRLYTQYLQELGAMHCFHYPLAECILEDKTGGKDLKCQSIEDEKQVDISFVGNLYNDTKNRLRKAELSSYAAGYVEGLISAQLLVYGYNFVRDSMPEDIVKEIIQACDLTLGQEYIQDEGRLAADAVGMEISAREREMVLRRLGEHFPVELYTGSKLPPSLQTETIHTHGYADYETEVPHIFSSSKININITSKTIESGIPQRVFDILSCGGFCMTNYQPEIAEYFSDGEELVMYTSMEDLLLKTEYYLTHEEERVQIARSGCRKVKEHFALAPRVAEMFGKIH
jgi:spore maturation protein CgeB